LLGLAVTAVALPSPPKSGVLRVGIIGHFDGDALLAGFHVPSLALPSIAGGVEICIRRNFDRYTRLRLPIVAWEAVPTASIASDLSMTWYFARIRLRRGEP